MMVRVPPTAPRTPPDTGASTRRTPRSSSRPARARVEVGSDELMSTTMSPLARASAESSSASTDSTIRELGSMRITTRAARLASAAVSAGRPPRLTRRARAASSTSKPDTG
ncbi:Uncharacterised protein [Mycobacteroides abscessus subsp. abscessus]|nr:Uncharacterised protein [Mycobacteroides abscessus subsp. abscessus]